MTDVARYGPWAVILGGSEGVGAEVARRLAADGFDLVLVARKPGALEASAQRARELGAEVRTFSLDLADPASAAALIDGTADLEVGLLICNAGANNYGHRFLDGDPEGFQGVIDLNITTPLALTHHYGRSMRERGRGGIVFVGSLAGYLGAARESIYGAAKAFVRIFAEGLWLELREHGVDVVDVVLGVTRTPAMERAGLNFEAPGLVVGEPADIARDLLAHLADGPVRIAAGNEAIVESRGRTDRARLVLRSHEAMRRLLPEGGQR